TTDFGRLLLVKTALVAVVALLGAANHFRHVPQASISAVRRNGSLEIALAAFALLATAALVDLAPPVQVAAASVDAQPPRVVADGSDYATTVRLAVSLAPGLVGFNQFDVRLTDYDTGDPLDANGVTLRFHPEIRPDIANSSLRLSPTNQKGMFSGN